MKHRLSFAQDDWFLRMDAATRDLHEMWYAGTQQVEKTDLFVETKRKINAAAAKLNIEVVKAFDEDGWDGEMYEPIVTLRQTLSKIKELFMTREEFSRMVADHDLTYVYSNGRSYYDGEKQKDAIMVASKLLPWEVAVQIWNSYVDRKLQPSVRSDWYWK